MRLFALAALLGSISASTKLAGQSLAEHAATISGASIGTAAGKPIGTALGNIFGNVDKSASNAAALKTSKRTGSKPVRGTITESPGHNAVPQPSISAEVPDVAPGVGAGSSHRPARRSELAGNPAPWSAPSSAPVFAAPVVKEPSVADVASIKVGATATDLHAALGPPESKVSIPDDGHLIEICQYWANGEQVGTIRLDNGHVVSVQARN